MPHTYIFIAKVKTMYILFTLAMKKLTTFLTDKTIINKIENTTQMHF